MHNNLNIKLYISLQAEQPQKMQRLYKEEAVVSIFDSMKRTAESTFKATPHKDIAK